MTPDKRIKELALEIVTLTSTKIQDIDVVEKLLTKYDLDRMSEVAKEILVACQKDVDWGEEHQQMVSVRGKAKCLEIIKLLSQ